MSRSRGFSGPSPKAGRFDRPVDADLGVVPGDPDLARRRVEVGALVREHRPLAEHAEPMGEPGRNVELPLVLRGQGHALPLAERRRADPHVDRDVEHFALENEAELALVVRVLKVEAAQDALGGKRHVVLNELAGRPASA